MIKVHTAHLNGIEAYPSRVEVSVSRGIGYYLIGLPDATIRESSYRLASALSASGYRIPGKRITLNITPADVRKNGSSFDLALAIGLLMGTGQIPFHSLDHLLFWGELGLDGTLNPTPGVLSVAFMAKKEGYKAILIPKNHIEEVQGIDEVDIYAFEHFTEVLAFLNDPSSFESAPSCSWEPESPQAEIDFNQIKGQRRAKRALELAATGKHHVFMLGPPGVGKTLLARAIPGILPALSREESQEISLVHTANRFSAYCTLPKNRPFRSPHHSISRAGLLGGGHHPKPGEISLAHHGVLFLDELPEFRREALEGLREPLEEGLVRINRGQIPYIFPAQFLCIAGANPSPDGHFYSEENPPRSSPAQIRRYLHKLSGPFLDRLDLHLELNDSLEDLAAEKGPSESSVLIRKRVEEGVAIQRDRYRHLKSVRYNAQLSAALIDQYCPLDRPSKRLLNRAAERFSLSMRSRHRIQKLARTIADMEQEDRIRRSHLAEAIHFRVMDRKDWFNPL